MSSSDRNNIYIVEVVCVCVCVLNCTWNDNFRYLSPYLFFHFLHIKTIQTNKSTTFLFTLLIVFIHLVYIFVCWLRFDLATKLMIYRVFFGFAIYTLFSFLFISNLNKTYFTNIYVLIYDAYIHLFVCLFFDRISVLVVYRVLYWIPMIFF